MLDKDVQLSETIIIVMIGSSSNRESPVVAPFACIYIFDFLSFCSYFYPGSFCFFSFYCNLLFF